MRFNTSAPGYSNASHSNTGDHRYSQWNTISYKNNRVGSLKGARRFSEVILSVLIEGKEVMARCLLDTGCTKSMTLKKFTDKKRQTKLSDKDSIRY